MNEATPAGPRAIRPALSTEAYVAGIRGGDRAVLARAITLVESTRPEHTREAQQLLQALLPHTGKAFRLGITGVPGVGKSTTIDQLGMNLLARGHKVAVLAVDPTSKRTGGSILGDKTRMSRLALEPDAFIRPSPTAGTLGGVTRKTRETMALVEAAGFDVVVVETVGVGQSEVAVADMVDFFLVLLLAGGGDDLQGIKKGIIELADMIAINKADGDNVTRAERAASEYRGALPAYRVQFADGGLAVYVAENTGAVTARRSDLWRLYDTLWALHIMDWRNHEDFNHPLIVAAAWLTLLSVIAGIVLIPYRIRFTRNSGAAR